MIKAATVWLLFSCSEKKGSITLLDVLQTIVLRCLKKVPSTQCPMNYDSSFHRYASIISTLSGKHSSNVRHCNASSEGKRGYMVPFALTSSLKSKDGFWVDYKPVINELCCH